VASLSGDGEGGATSVRNVAGGETPLIKAGTVAVLLAMSVEVVVG
jgi:hypothetical protein